MIAAGTRLVFDVTGTAGGWLPTTTDATRSAIIAQLNPYFRVEGLTLRPVGAIYELLEWPFTARVTVVTQVGYAKVQDPASIVAHAVYEATGHLPAVSEPGIQALPSPGVLGPIGDAVTDGVTAIKDALAATLGGVQDSVNLTLVLAAGVLIIVALSAGGKTTGIKLS